jgi:hypothetical protein
MSTATLPDKFDELAARVAADDAERERARRAELAVEQVQQDALLATAREIVESALGPCDVVREWGWTNRFLVKPVVWRGVVEFSIWAYDGRWYCGRHGQDSVPADWENLDAARFLVRLQRSFETRLAQDIGYGVDRLTAARSHAAAAEALAALLKLAPERADEWNALAEEVRAGIAQREAAVDAYIAALGDWRAKRQGSQEFNKELLAEAQARLDREFERCEASVFYRAVDEDGVNCIHDSRIWLLDAEDAHGYAELGDGYYRVFDSGRIEVRKLFNVAWIGAPVRQRLMEAGYGPWRATVYFDDIGEKLYALPWDVEEAHRLLDDRLEPLAEEPDPYDFGLDGNWTAAERDRIEAAGHTVRSDEPF